MKYKKLTPETGSLSVCYICGNEDIVQNAEYCHICGSPVVNKCTFNSDQYGDYPCGMAKENPIPTNARYCPYCASPTSFNQILDDWKIEKEKIENGALDWNSEISDSDDTPF